MRSEKSNMDEFARNRAPKLLSPESLNQFYQSQRKHPTWNRDWMRLAFGVELEFLLHDREGKPARRKQFEAFFNALLSNSEFYLRQRGSLDHPISLSMECPNGYVSVKPDFSYNVLEIAFPPMQDFETLEFLYTNVLSAIDAALAIEGLKRSSRSALWFDQSELDFVDLARLKGFQAEIQNRKEKSEFTCAWFPALCASTQIHLNCFEDTSLALLPALYSTEWLVLCLFSSPEEIKGSLLQHPRTALYEETFGTAYELKTVPRTIPNDVTTYAALFNSSPQYFPNDPFFPVRDYAYIRPRSMGTLEFRSSGVLKDYSDVADLVAFRAAQLSFAISHSSNQEKPVDFNQLRARFLERAYASTPLPLNETEKAILRLFKDCLHAIPIKFAQRVTQRMEKNGL